MRRLWIALIGAVAASVLAAGGLVACSAPHTADNQVGAQAGAAGAQRGGARFGQLLLSLNLSDDQKSQIRSIMAAARQHNQGITDPQQRRENLRNAFAKIRSVLTPEQQAKLAADTKAAQARRRAAAAAPNS